MWLVAILDSTDLAQLHCGHQLGEYSLGRGLCYNSSQTPRLQMRGLYSVFITKKESIPPPCIPLRHDQLPNMNTRGQDLTIIPWQGKGTNIILSGRWLKCSVFHTAGHDPLVTSIKWIMPTFF